MTATVKIYSTLLSSLLARYTFNFLTLLALMLFITACASNAGVKERNGRSIGAIVGQFVGAISGNNNKTTKMLAGSVIGSLIGGRIGRSMDIRDRRKLNHTLENNRSTHSTIWININSGIKYSVTPMRTYRNTKNNSPCREYETVAIRRRKRYIERGRACRDQRGYWISMRGGG